MTDANPDLTLLLPDEETLEARRAALVDTVAGGDPGRPPHRSRRRWSLAAAGALVAAGVAAVLVVSAGGGDTPKAFAVEPQAGGGTTIRVYDPEDAAGLEAALAEAGVRSEVTWLRTGEACREPYFQKSKAKEASGEELSAKGWAGLTRPSGLMEIAIMSSARWTELKAEEARGEAAAVEFFKEPPNIVIEPASFGPEQSVVISGFKGPFFGHPEGGYEFHFNVAEGPVGACEPFAQPGGGILGLMNRQSEASAGQ
jgi:hypothetical protein